MRCPDPKLNLPDAPAFPEAYAQVAEDVLLMLEYNMRRYLAAVLEGLQAMPYPRTVSVSMAMSMAVRNQSAEHVRLADEALSNEMNLNAMLRSLDIDSTPEY